MNKPALLEAFNDFLEKVEPAWKKFNDIADEYLIPVQKEAEKALNRFDEEVRMRALQNALKDEDPIGAELAINFEGIEKKLIPVGKILTETLMDGAQATVPDIFAVSRGAEDVTPAIEKANNPTAVSIAGGLGISFDQAEKWAAENAGIMVTAVTDQTKLGVRDIIANSIADGIPPRAAAREIRQIVGLTQRQANSVVNFKRDLEDQMARGKSPFKTVPLTQERIDRMTDKFSKKQLKFRSEMIARTETIRSSNMGQQAIWEQAAERGLIDENVAVRRWIVTNDDRLCPFCRPMDGQTVPLRGQFQSGIVELKNGGLRSFDPTLTPPLHPACRCAVLLDISPTGTIAGVDKPIPIAPLPTKFSDFENVRENLRSGITLSRIGEFKGEKWFLKKARTEDSLNEIMSSKIGKYFGVEVPEIAPFKHEGVWWVASKDVNIGFPGAKSARQFLNDIGQENITRFEFDTALSRVAAFQRMALFDALIGNADRHLSNFNILGSKGSMDEIENILAIDHGAAFIEENVKFLIPNKLAITGVGKIKLDARMKAEFITLLNGVSKELTQEWLENVPEDLLSKTAGLDVFRAGIFLSRAKALLDVLT